MDDIPRLPSGLSTRSLVEADAPAVTRLIATQEQEDLGSVEIEEADIVADWAKPSHDVSARSVGVLDGDRLVGYAELMGVDRADAAVLPSHRGRGIGTFLAGWLRELGRSVGSPVIGMPVPVGSPGDRLLESLGYRVRWHSWILQLPEGTEIAPRSLPDGYAVREARPEDHRAVHGVLEDAFLEWSERPRESFEDFAASTMGRPDFAPWNLRVATDPTGEVVGVVQVHIAAGKSWVPRLAVRRDQRNRGLAQALLVDAFTRGREHGGRVSELSTDSRTGALSLYERVGMVVTTEWVNRATDL